MLTLEQKAAAEQQPTLNPEPTARLIKPCPESLQIKRDIEQQLILEAELEAVAVLGYN